MSAADELRLREARNACRTWSQLQGFMSALPDIDGRIARHNQAMERLGEAVWSEPTRQVQPAVREHSP